MIVTDLDVIRVAVDKPKADTPLRVHRDRVLPLTVILAHAGDLHGMPVRRGVLHYRQSNDYAGLTDVAPALFNAALVSRLNSMGVTGAPMELSKLTMKTMVRYMKSHEGIRRVSDGLKAAGQASP